MRGGLKFQQPQPGHVTKKITIKVDRVNEKKKMYLSEFLIYRANKLFTANKAAIRITHIRILTKTILLTVYRRL